MKYICDTAKECADTICRHRKPHETHDACYRVWCKDVSCHVRCNPVPVSLFEEMVRGIYSTPAPKMETHACYYCQHEGTDVNRIATPLSKFNEKQTVYCCDDGDGCGKRVKAKRVMREANGPEDTIRNLGANDHERDLRRIVISTLAKWDKRPRPALGSVVNEAVARIVELSRPETP
ncbi:hypothetical protein LCGC14_2417680 [marine sediment metagenome]|uniref:Uncharacterized protein n=1 Tax=marine sediment metagenome TaxID=412755 RepID=A0A0F9E2T0_9ZZZZ